MAKNKEKDTGFSAKWAKKLPEGFMDSAESMSTEELKVELVSCERVISGVEQDMEDDEKLTAAKEMVKDLAGAYRDTLGCQKAKIKALVWIMEGRGAI